MTGESNTPSVPLNCDVCGRALPRGFYRVCVSDHPASEVVVCLRAKCGRKALGLAEEQLGLYDRRTYEPLRMEKFVR